jgi:beta-phosphoglucomutase
MFKGAIFDLDGVIVNTVPFHFNAWKKMFSEYGVDFTFSDYEKKVDGIPRYNGAKAILTSLNDEEIHKAGDKKQNYFLEMLEREEIPIYDSSVKLIKELKQCGKKIAVASSSKNCKTILIKTDLINLIDAIVDGSDVKIGKPHPGIFLLAAERLNCPYETCIVFEDAVLGIEAAINGNMKCIGIDRYKNPDRLKKATLVVNDLKEVTCKTIEELFQQ